MNLCNVGFSDAQNAVFIFIFIFTNITCNIHYNIFISSEYYASSYSEYTHSAGAQGNDWIHGQTYIGRREEFFKVNITATVGGSGVQGDIAIDEISFKNCAPPPICPGASPGKFM